MYVYEKLNIFARLISTVHVIVIFVVTCICSFLVPRTDPDHQAQQLTDPESPPTDPESPLTDPESPLTDPEQHQEQRDLLEHPLFLVKSSALSYIKPGAGKRTPWQTLDGQMVFRGAACECCHNRCSIFEMTQYCVNSDAALSAWGIGKE